MTCIISSKKAQNHYITNVQSNNTFKHKNELSQSKKSNQNENYEYHRWEPLFEESTQTKKRCET